MYFDTLRRPDAEIEYKFSFPQRACRFWSNSLLSRFRKAESRILDCLAIGTRRSCIEVHFATRSSNLSQNFHAKLICSYELLDIMTSILDLKNPKNHKINKSHSFSDILDGDSPVELETEPKSIEPDEKPISEQKDNDYFKEYQDIDPADRLFEEAPAGIDKSGPIPNNAEDMILPATLTSLAWTAPDKHHELISHVLRKWVIIVLTAMAFVALFWQGSILTGITFFALALVTSMHFWREAKHEKYEIHPHGIAAGDQFHHYHDLESFCIHYHPEGYHELSLCTGKLLNHYVKIPLKNQNPFEIRDALVNYLPEKKHEEGLEDLLRRKLGL